MSEEQNQQGSVATQSQAPALSATEQLRTNAANLFGGASKSASTASQPETSRGESQDTSLKDNRNQSESDQLPSSEEQTNATNLEADKPKQFQSKGDKRFQQMANEIRELKTLLSQNGKQPAAESKPQEVPALVPKPQKPSFTKEQLDTAEAIALKNNDEVLLKSVAEEREKLRQHSLDERFWKLENDKALSKYQETQNHYITEAVKKWPDIAKTESPHYQMFERLSKQVPELLARPQGDGHYLLAEVAHTYLMNQELTSKLAALESKTQQTETENKGLQKRIAPAVQTKSLNLGASTGKKMTANEELRQRMTALQEAGQLGK